MTPAWVIRYLIGVQPSIDPTECGRGSLATRDASRPHVAASPRYSGQRLCSHRVDPGATKTRSHRTTSRGAPAMTCFVAMPRAQHRIARTGQMTSARGRKPRVWALVADPVVVLVAAAFRRTISAARIAQ